MTKLQIDLDEWIKSLGVAPLVSAYYDIENERKVDEWRELLADGCVQYAAFDGNEPGNGLAIRPHRVHARSVPDVLHRALVSKRRVEHGRRRDRG